jgi:hypothetical protein
VSEQNQVRFNAGDKVSMWYMGNRHRNSIVDSVDENWAYVGGLRFDRIDGCEPGDHPYSCIKPISEDMEWWAQAEHVSDKLLEAIAAAQHDTSAMPIIDRILQRFRLLRLRRLVKRLNTIAKRQRADKINCRVFNLELTEACRQGRERTPWWKRLWHNAGRGNDPATGHYPVSQEFIRTHEEMEANIPPEHWPEDVRTGHVTFSGDGQAKPAKAGHGDIKICLTLDSDSDAARDFRILFDKTFKRLAEESTWAHPIRGVKTESVAGTDPKSKPE